MTTETIDQAERIEAERLAKRASVRRQIAKLQVEQSRIRDLNAVIAKVNAQTDSASDEHQAACLPLQSELAELESKQIERLANRQPADPAEDARRAEIVAKIGEHNRQLELVIEANKSTVAGIHKQISEITQAGQHRQENETTLRNRLAGELATEPQRDRQWLLQQRIRFANARYDAAKRTAEDIAGVLAPDQNGRIKGDIGILRERLRRWKLEELDACQQRDEAVAESEALRRECIDGD